ncbi:hypothetical protein BE17_06025 [Sorangium cellulosum]|uniref:Tryptophan synthase alpha chain n=1 Tax=Sorangium cellulosum TaxID=56 RepID=A0A150SCL4_SORCE|nr:hypothetical protein BE17_06025 [Sorangium cellulosum]
MVRSKPRCAVASIFLVGSALFYACGDGPYSDGRCAVTDHCQSELQNIPGTICVGGHCTCARPGEGICCARGEEEANCFYECRPCNECGEKPAECAGIPEPAGWCDTDADCEAPPDARCGTGRCAEGKCTLEIHPGPIGSQVRGDCKQLECTSAGELVEAADAFDVYDDGNECTADLCSAGVPRNTPLLSLVCPDTGAGLCYEGRCVECYAANPTTNDCPSGYACDDIACVLRHCVNTSLDTALGETDFNCGGPCRPCPEDARCLVGADCIGRVCAGGFCRAPTCDDDTVNGPETGEDCGGGCPVRCPAGEGCQTGADCASGVCWAGVCETPTCKDGVENGDELGVDCGGEHCDRACPEP